MLQVDALEAVPALLWLAAADRLTSTRSSVLAAGRDSMPGRAAAIFLKSACRVSDHRMSHSSCQVSCTLQTEQMWHDIVQELTLSFILFCCTRSHSDALYVIDIASKLRISINFHSATVTSVYRDAMP